MCLEYYAISVYVTYVKSHALNLHAQLYSGARCLIFG